MSEWLIYTSIIIIVIIIIIIFYIYHTTHSGTPANNGSTCTSSDDCSPGLVCLGGTCVKSSSGGMVGDSCSAVKPCESSLYCAANNKCYGGDPPIVGQNCKNATDCLSTQYCSGLNTCQKVPAAGTGNKCTLSSDCIQANYCNSKNVCEPGPGLVYNFNQVVLEFGTPNNRLQLVVDNNIVKWQTEVTFKPSWCYDNSTFLLRYRKDKDTVLFTNIDSDGSIRTITDGSKASIIYIELLEFANFFLRDQHGNYAKSMNDNNAIVYFDGPQYDNPSGLPMTMVSLVGDSQDTC